MPFREATSADLNKTTLDYSEIWNADDIRITCSFFTYTALNTLNGRVTLHLAISSHNKFHFGFVLPKALKRDWIQQSEDPPVWFSAKGHAERVTFTAFLKFLYEKTEQQKQNQQQLSLIIDQNQNQQSIWKNQKDGRFQFILLPVGTTRHSQSIDQILHDHLKNKFKNRLDFRVSLSQITEEIKTELRRELTITNSWRLVRRKFPRCAVISPKLRVMRDPWTVG